MTGDRAARTAELLYGTIVVLFRRLRQFRVDGELTPGESFALSRLDHLAPVTASDLAYEEGISPQTIGATLSALQARGLVARRRDAEDARKVVLEVTDAGRVVLDRKRTARAEQFRATLAEQFSEEELDRLDAAAPVLVKLAEALGDPTDDQPGD